MLTPPVINRIPRGLLDFFGLKTGGRNPQQLAETIAPVLDLWNLYEQDSIDVFQESVGVPAGGALGPFDFGGVGIAPGIVPADEMWHFREYSILLVCAAGITDVQVVPEVQVPITFGVAAGARTTITVGDPARYTGAAAGVMRLRCFARDFWLPPGGVIGGYTAALAPAATAINAIASGSFVRYKR